MSRIDSYTCIFPEEFPRIPAEGTMYVSLKDHLCVYLCPCGCKSIVSIFVKLRTDNFDPGKEVWDFSFNMGKPSLSPSINCIDFDCKSHYFIRKGKVEWV